MLRCKTHENMGIFSVLSRNCMFKQKKKHSKHYSQVCLTACSAHTACSAGSAGASRAAGMAFSASKLCSKPLQHDSCHSMVDIHSISADTAGTACSAGSAAQAQKSNSLLQILPASGVICSAPKSAALDLLPEDVRWRRF